MKKTILATAILLGLSACGSDNDKADTPDDQDVNVAASFGGDLSATSAADQSTIQGSVSVTDPDAGEANISPQSNISTTYGTFSIAANGDYTYTVNTNNSDLVALPESASVSESLIITSVDGTSTSIGITITGVNNSAAFSSGDGVDALEIDNTQSAAVSGTIVVIDPDTGEASISPQTNQQTSYGTFSIDANGAWTYVLDTNNNTIATLLDETDSVTDDITIQSLDNTVATISVTITGTAQNNTVGLTKGSIGSNDQVPSVSCTSVVTSTSALESAASYNMTPGETLCLASGNYSGLDLSFGGTGSSDLPITIAAEVPGTVTIDGEVFVGMTGEYVVLQGFIFQDGTIDSSLVQTRGNSNTPCNNCRITENAFIDMDRNVDDSTKWFQIYGSNNRFDHNWVSGKVSRGALLIIERGSEPGTEDRTLIDHNYFGNRPPKDGLGYADGSDNEYEGIRVGSSDTHTSDSFATIEHNYFEGIDGEAEVISIKAGGVTVQHNTIRNSRGSIVSRHGEGSTISNNFIIGDGNPFSGGIRVVDADHSITNNYIEGARYLSTNFNGGLLVSNSDGSTTNGYQNVENVLVANNTVVDSVNSINLFAGNRSTRPDSVYFVNNLVARAIGPVVVNADTLPTNPVFAGNYVHGPEFSDDASVNDIAGFSFVEPMLSRGSDGLLRPNQASANLMADLAASIGSYSLPTLDMDGQTRSNATLSGADEIIDDVLLPTELRGVLSPSLVGPLSYTAPMTNATVKTLTINNANFDGGDLSGWSNNNANITTVSGEVFSNGASAVVSGPNNSFSQVISVTPSTNYTLSAFMAGKASMQASVGTVDYSVDHSAASYGFESLSFASGGETQITITAKVDSTVTSEVALNNPNFDNAQDGWVINEGNGIGQVQDSSNSSSSTDGSIKFKYNDVDSGNPYDPYIAQTISVTPNTTYTIKMYVLLKSNDAQDATVEFGAHSGAAIQDGEFDRASILASKNSVYADLSEQDEAEDSFRPDTVTFNSGSNTSVTIFAQYNSNDGDDIRIDEFSVSSTGAPSADTKAFFDDFRLISHPNLN